MQTSGSHDHGSDRSGEHAPVGDPRPPAPEPCGRAGLSATDEALERSVLDLLAARAPGATICPSEAARAVGGDDWRPLMEAARAAARRLVARGEVEITQGGQVVDASTAKGPVRVRRVQRG